MELIFDSRNPLGSVELMHFIVVFGKLVTYNGY